MNKKALILASLLVGSMAQGNAMAFGVPSFGGGSDKSESTVNWSDVAGTGQDALVDIALGSKYLGDALVSMAEALDLKDQAATLKAKANSINEDGSQSSANLEEIQNNSESLGKLVVDQLKNADKLTAKQKEALGDAATEWSVGAIRYVKGVEGGVDIAKQAKDAPMMEKAKFVDVVTIVPVAAKGGMNLLSTGPQLFELLTSNGVKTPDLPPIPSSFN